MFFYSFHPSKTFKGTTLGGAWRHVAGIFASLLLAVLCTGCLIDAAVGLHSLSVSLRDIESGAYGRADLHVIRELHFPVQGEVSLTLSAHPDATVSQQDLDHFRAMIVGELYSWGFTVSSAAHLDIQGTVTRWHPGDPSKRFWHFGAASPGKGSGYFGSTWVVLSQTGEELGRASIVGSIHRENSFRGSFQDVLWLAASKLGRFLTKRPHQDAATEEDEDY